MPMRSSQINAPVLRVCHAKTRCAAPQNTSSHPTKMVTAIPAAAGTTIARMPARIIRMLRAMDQPTDCFAVVTNDGVLIAVPPCGFRRPVPVGVEGLKHNWTCRTRAANRRNRREDRLGAAGGRCQRRCEDRECFPRSLVLSIRPRVETQRDKRGQIFKADDSTGCLFCNGGSNLTHGFDVAEDLVEGQWIVALRLTCRVIGQHDQAVNPRGGKCFHGTSVKRTDGRDGDFEIAEFGRASMLIGGTPQALDVLLGLLDGKAKTIPAVAQGDGATERRRTSTADDDGWHGALDREWVGDNTAEGC